MKTSTSILILVIAITLSFFYVKPQYDKLNLLKFEYAQYEDALNKAKELKVVRDQLLEKYKSIPDEDIDKLKKVVPEKYNPIKLVADLNGIAGKYGMVLSDVTIKENNQVASINEGPENISLYKIVSVDFSTKGSYENFILILKDLENNVQLADVKTLAVSPLKEGEKSIGLNFKVSVDTYWLK